MAAFSGPFGEICGLEPQSQSFETEHKINGMALVTFPGLPGSKYSEIYFLRMGTGCSIRPIEWFVQTVVVIWRKSKVSESQSRLLADRIYEQLKADIITCKYQPGDSLTEIEMANKFNVSRTPIREVCNRLLKEDLLHSIPYKGYIVSPFNLQDLHELYQIRLILEPYAAEMAARNPSPRFLEALRENLRTGGQYSQPDDFIKFIDADLDFHHLIATGCGNRRLTRIISDLRNQIERLVYLIFEHYGPYDDVAFDDHHGIVRAIEARDTAAAGEFMTRHIENYRARALQALASEQLA